MTIKRAYCIAYLLMFPLLFCWAVEIAGTFGDGATSTSKYIMPFWGNLFAIAQLNLIINIWLHLKELKSTINSFFLRCLLHTILALPFIISVIRIPYFILSPFYNFPGLIQFIIVLTINIVILIYLKECYWYNHLEKKIPK